MLGPVYLMIGLWKQYPTFNPLYITLIGLIVAVLVLIFGPNEKE